MLTTNLLQAMLVRRAEQSHQHRQSSNNALLMHWAYTQLKSEAITMRSSARWSLHIHRMTTTSLHTCYSLYNIHTYTAKAQLSFCAHTDRCDAVNRLISRIFRSIYTQRNHTQSSNSALFTRWTHIWYTHIYCEGTTQLCTSTRLHDAVNQSIFRFIRLMYMHCNYIHCKDTTQSLLIYTERQQRLCACAATNIQHSHSHCKDTIQLLRIYTSVQRSKSIDFSHFQADLHAAQSHTEQ